MRRVTTETQNYLGAGQQHGLLGILDDDVVVGLIIVPVGLLPAGVVQEGVVRALTEVNILNPVALVVVSKQQKQKLRITRGQDIDSNLTWSAQWLPAKPS